MRVGLQRSQHWQVWSLHLHEWNTRAHVIKACYLGILLVVPESEDYLCHDTVRRRCSFFSRFVFAIVVPLVVPYGHLISFDPLCLHNFTPRRLISNFFLQKNYQRTITVLKWKIVPGQNNDLFFVNILLDRADAAPSLAPDLWNFYLQRHTVDLLWSIMCGHHQIQAIQSLPYLLAARFSSVRRAPAATFLLCSRPSQSETPRLRSHRHVGKIRT